MRRLFPTGFNRARQTFVVAVIFLCLGTISLVFWWPRYWTILFLLLGLVFEVVSLLQIFRLPQKRI